MFREMRRKIKQTSKEETEKVLNTCTNGVLGVFGDDGYPYTVPVSYVYDDNKIYFHSANQGHKVDGIKSNPKVSFCVVARDNIIPEEFNTDYESVIGFGKARILEDEKEIKDACQLIIDKYSKEYQKIGHSYIKGEWGNFVLVEIQLEHITGKGGTQ